MRLGYTTGPLRRPVFCTRKTVMSNLASEYDARETHWCFGFPSLPPLPQLRVHNKGWIIPSHSTDLCHLRNLWTNEPGTGKEKPNWDLKKLPRVNRFSWGINAGLRRVEFKQGRKRVLFSCHRKKKNNDFRAFCFEPVWSVRGCSS